MTHRHQIFFDPAIGECKKLLLGFDGAGVTTVSANANFCYPWRVKVVDQTQGQAIVSMAVRRLVPASSD